MNEQTYEYLQPIVDSVAREYARKFWSTARLEHGDVAQVCWEWALAHPGKLAEWMESEDAHKPIRTSMRNAALDACQKEKASRLGYSTDDLHYWNKGEIEGSLSAMFTYEAWLEPPQSEGRSTKALHEGGNYIASLADLSQAFSKLPGADQYLLKKLHQLDLLARDVAEDEDVAVSTIYKRAERAYKRLADILGGPAPRQGAMHSRDDNGDCECGWLGGPGSRRAMSGAQARAITAHAYDEEG